MIETNKERAIAAKNVQNPKIEEWMNSQKDALRISLGAPSDSVDYDLIISEDRIPNRNARLERLRKENFNRQQSWYKSGNALRDWESGPFHLGNKIIMATWICGKAKIEGLTFLDVAAEDLVESKYERRTFRSVMKQLIEEFGIGVRYTASHSQLFHELGAVEIDPQTKGESEISSLNVPTVENIFDNVHLGTKIDDGNVLEIDANGIPTATLRNSRTTDKQFFLIGAPDRRLSEKNPSRVILTDPSDKEAITEAVRFFENQHEIYILSREMFRKVELLKEQFNIDHNLLPSTLGFLGFTFGEDFEYIRTDGLIEQAPYKESQLLQAVAKERNITHA